MSTRNEIYVGYAISLAGGVLIIIGSLLGMFSMFYFGWVGGWGMMGGGHMMGGWYAWPWWSSGMGVFIIFPIIGLISGILVTIGAVKLHSSADTSTWGTIIIVFSIISFIGGGGFFLGAILGLIGGILAITLKS
ncbi:MAG: hypothetical protein ACP5GU_07675 [Thermoprotei archaeon]|jgi:hypothetical protein